MDDEIDNLPQKKESALPQKSLSREIAEVAVRNKTLIVRGGAIAVGVGVLAASASLIKTAVIAGSGVLVLGAIILVLIGFSQMLPFLGQKLENKILAMRKKEAQDNPVEQLDNRVIVKRKKLQSAKEAVAIIIGYTNGLARMIENEKKEDPGHNIAHLERSLESFKQFIAKEVRELKDVEKRMIEFELKVKRWKFERKFTEKGQVALASIHELKGGDMTEEILTDESIITIEGDFDALLGKVDLDALLAKAADLKEKSPELIQVEGRDDDIEIPAIVSLNVEKIGRRR